MSVFIIYLWAVMKVKCIQGGPSDKEPLPANAEDVRDAGSIPGSGRCPSRRRGNPLQYSCLENPIDKRTLAGYSPWGHTELDTIEVT